MKKTISKKWKIWVIRISFFLIVVIILFSLLYFTDNTNLFLEKLNEKIRGFSIITVVFFILVLIGGIFLGKIKKYITGLLFPDEKKAKNEDVDKILENTSKIIEQINIDPRIIKEHLDDLSDFTIEQKEIKINEWYNNFEISGSLKDSLIVIIKHIHETILSLEKRIKTEKDKDYSKALENLKGYLEKGNSKQIKNNYYQYIKQQNKKKIELLKSSIDAAQQLFAFDDTIEFYKELIKLESIPQNHFYFGLFLQKLNYFDDANIQYEEALKIYRELAKENPRTYLPNVATTLNNLAVLHSDKKEFPQALGKCEEALKIRRELAKENPETYLPDVATTLNNLANLHSDKNELPQALEKFEEALKIRRELAKENLNRYEIDYAKSLIMGVYYFDKESKDLKEAKRILSKGGF